MPFLKQWPLPKKIYFIERSIFFSILKWQNVILSQINEPKNFHFQDHHRNSTVSGVTVTSDSDPFDYDMSNRAQLPKGIEKIRPHLESMDNVPLLVSLFAGMVFLWIFVTLKNCFLKKNVSFPHEAIWGLDFFSARVDAFPHITSGRRPRVIGKCINECWETV